MQTACTVSIPLGCQYIPMDPLNGHAGIGGGLDLKGLREQMANRTDQTHVEPGKGPNEIVDRWI